jgi:hypothetical protein
VLSYAQNTKYVYYTWPKQKCDNKTGATLGVIKKIAFQGVI